MRDCLRNGKKLCAHHNDAVAGLAGYEAEGRLLVLALNGRCNLDTLAKDRGAIIRLYKKEDIMTPQKSKADFNKCLPKYYTLVFCGSSAKNGPFAV